MLSPLTWLLLSLLAVLLARGLSAYPRSRAGLATAGMIVALVSIAAMTPWAANALVGALEAPRAVATGCRTAPPSVAVVLAAGVDRGGPATEGPEALDLASRRRIERAVRWWRAEEGRRLVVSGGPQGHRTATSALMAAHARALGLPADAIRTEERSATTWDSAGRLAQLHPPLPPRIVLVTSALHMPRARYAMEQAGFKVCPLPADHRQVPFALPGFLLPGGSALAKTEAALHERVGLAYYRWRRWRDGPPQARR